MSRHRRSVPSGLAGPFVRGGVDTSFLVNAGRAGGSAMPGRPARRGSSASSRSPAGTTVMAQFPGGAPSPGRIPRGRRGVWPPAIRPWRLGRPRSVARLRHPTEWARPETVRCAPRRAWSHRPQPPTGCLRRIWRAPLSARPRWRPSKLGRGGAGPRDRARRKRCNWPRPPASAMTMIGIRPSGPRPCRVPMVVGAVSISILSWTRQLAGSIG
jgi:hypothetical protein